MPEISPIVVKAASGLAIDLLKTFVSTVRIHKTVSPAQVETKSCIVCQIHQHVVMANGYIRGIHSRLNEDGSVPLGLGGTIPQAREHLHDAMMEIPTVMGAHPSIDMACKRLSTLLPEIDQGLEHVATREDWELLLLKLEMAEDAAYSIPETVYRRDIQVPTEEPDPEKIVILSSSDKELLDLLKAMREGKLSRDQSREALDKLLGGTKS